MHMCCYEKHACNAFTIYLARRACNTYEVTSCMRLQFPLQHVRSNFVRTFHGSALNVNQIVFIRITQYLNIPSQDFFFQVILWFHGG